MKKAMWYFLLLSTGCDPALTCWISNTRSEQVYIKTTPAIAPAYLNWVKRKKANAVREVKPGEYVLAAKGRLLLYSGFAGYGLDSLPYHSIQIITPAGTISYPSRPALIDAFSQPGSGTYFKRRISVPAKDKL